MLYTVIQDWAQLDTGSTVLDVCCGTGTIGLALAPVSPPAPPDNPTHVVTRLVTPSGPPPPIPDPLSLPKCLLPWPSLRGWGWDRAPRVCPFLTSEGEESRGD